jgi:hypothetical protein
MPVSGFKSDLSLFLIEFCNLNKDRKIYFGCTVPPYLLEKLSGNLYPTGLAFLYSEERIRNLEMLESNWAKYDTQGLEQEMKANYSVNKSSGILRNYLLPMLLLYKHFKAKDEKEKSVEIYNRIKIISSVMGNPTHLREFLDENK